MMMSILLMVLMRTPLRENSSKCFDFWESLRQAGGGILFTLPLKDQPSILV